MRLPSGWGASCSHWQPRISQEIRRLTSRLVLVLVLGGTES